MKIKNIVPKSISGIALLAYITQIIFYSNKSELVKVILLGLLVAMIIVVIERNIQVDLNQLKVKVSYTTLILLVSIVCTCFILDINTPLSGIISRIIIISSPGIIYCFLYHKGKTQESNK